MTPTFVSLVSGSPAEIPMSLAMFAVGVFVVYLIGAVVIPETKGHFRDLRAARLKQDSSSDARNLI
jgi:hypothetical protein